MKRLFIIIFLTTFISCAPVRVDYDYDTSTDFSEYMTYNYYGELETGMNELDDKRLMSALDANLQSKNFVKSNDPDFYIDIKTESFQNINRGNTVGVGVGGTGRNVGGGVSVGLPLGNSKMTRRIIIEFRDEKGPGLFWQAVSESTYNPNANPEQREIQLKTVADKIMTNYPPSK